MTATRRLLAACLLLPLLAGCAILREFSPAVVMEPMSPGEYIALQRGDILTSDRLSAPASRSRSTICASVPLAWGAARNASVTSARIAGASPGPSSFT